MAAALRRSGRKRDLTRAARPARPARPGEAGAAGAEGAVAALRRLDLKQALRGRRKQGLSRAAAMVAAGLQYSGAEGCLRGRR